MDYDNAGTLVNRERAAALHSRPGGDAARYTHTDERTHAKRYYERDGHGREVYASYYNSDEDPTFQARYNTDGRRAFVSSTAFTFVSNGGMRGVAQPQSLRPNARAPTAVVEEENEESMRRGNTRATQAAQPIVEEPDDDDDDDSYAYMEKVRPTHRGREQVASQLSHLRHPDSSPFRDEYRERELYPLSTMARPRAMQDFFMDDFFGPRDPFRMMDTMRQQISRQRAAMFGGVDPFANFF